MTSGKIRVEGKIGRIHPRRRIGRIHPAKEKGDGCKGKAED